MQLNVFSFYISPKEKKELLSNSLFSFYQTSNVHIEYVFTYLNSKITIYNSQKCVVQGKDAFIVMQLFFKKHLDSNKLEDKFDFENKNFNQTTLGTDEVGVGDYFGGLIVCGVYLTPTKAKMVLDLGVKDSKKLDDNKIIKLAQQLMKVVEYEIAELTPFDYNVLFDKYQNSHVLKTVLHYSVIDKLSNVLFSKNNKVNEIIIDQYASERKFNQYLSKINIDNKFKNKITFITHAESKYLAVATASIIARYFFLMQIKKMSNNLNVQLPLGAWNSNIENTLFNLLIRYKNDSQKIDLFLNNYVKKHFSNTTKILDKLTKANY